VRPDIHPLEPKPLTAGACLPTRDKRFLRVGERFDLAEKFTCSIFTCSIKENS
jgi:hypothetical protein